MLILTGWNSKMAECGVLCVRSIERYLAKFPNFHFAFEPIPEDYERPASWHKVQSILKHLPDHDFVLWIDSDCLVVGSENIRGMLKDATLNIAMDHNGSNHGVAAWKNCKEAFWALETMDRGYKKWKDGPWFEQHVLHEIEGEIDVAYQTKSVFNAYYGVDVTDATQIIHWPGMSPKDRLPLMAEVFSELT